MKIYSTILLFLTSTSLVFAQYETPVFINPGDNIQAIINANTSGTLYIFKEGTHRMQKIVPKTDDILIGEPGTIINGALVLDNWQQEGEYWTHTIDPAFARTTLNNGDYPCKCVTEYPNVVDPNVCGELRRYVGCMYWQSLFMDDLPLWRETSFEGLNNLPDTLESGITVKPFYGDWLFDSTSMKFHIPFDPSGHEMEVTIKFPLAGFAIYPGGGSQPGVVSDNVLVKGLQIEKYVPTWAAVVSGEKGWIIENNDVRLNHSGGINIAGNSIVRSNKINLNGQSGIGGRGATSGNGDWSIVENNEIAYNNYARFDPNWSAVTKFGLSDSLILRNNYVHDNYGFGLWCDYRNTHIVYEGNLITNNGGAGIHHEISGEAIIRCNRFINNRSRKKPPLGSPDHTQALYIANGTDVVVSHNYVRQDSSGQGIVVVQNNRGAEFGGSPVEVINNDVVFSFPPVNNVSTSGLAPGTVSLYGDTLPVHAFDYNRYHIAEYEPNKLYFSHFNEEGENSAFNWADYQTAGFEVNGTVDTDIIDAPNYPECADIPKQILVKAKLLIDCLVEENSTEMTLPISEDRVHFQPFSSSRWNYHGKDVCPKFYENMIDWVLLEIREAANPDNILQQKAAILLSDGSIVDAYPSLRGVAQPGDMLDGVVIYDLIPNQEYVLSIKTTYDNMALANQAIVLPNNTPYNFTNIALVEDTQNYEIINSNTIALNCIAIPLALPEEEVQIEEDEPLENAFTLHPNPFSNQSTLSFYLKRDRAISIRLYSLLGEVVADILKNEKLESGEHQILIEGKNLESGVYFVQMTGFGISEVKPLVLVK